MRAMQKGNTKIKITEHIILKNFWEYYVIERDQDQEGIAFCLVIGLETELGDVYLPEIAPYIISRTKKIDEVAPATGWSWVEEQGGES